MMRFSKIVVPLLLAIYCIVLLAACSNVSTISTPTSPAEEVASNQIENTNTSEAEVPSTSIEAADNEQPSEPANGEGEIRIRLIFAGGETVAVLEDNPTTQSLLAQLPVTVSFEDFAGAEKIAYFPEDLSTQDAPDGYDPVIGDVACYGPWGNLVFYYKDQPYYGGIIPIGRVESGLDALSTMGTGFEVMIERME